jgi:hypothetical protein
MHFLILLLAALAFFLHLTFRLWKNPDARLYLALVGIIDAWLMIVLVYLLFSAAFDG